jgi:hypothetical protein
LEFVRLSISQETPPPSSGLKANGKIIKSIASGGDTHVARRNYDRFDSHIVMDTTILIMGNDDLEVDVKDTNEQRIRFNTVKQFKSRDFIDKMIEEGKSQLIIDSYKVANPDIKDLCKTVEWLNANTYLLYESFLDFPVPITRHDDDDDDFITLRETILKKYEITGDNNDICLVSDVIKDMCGFCNKVNSELLNMGVIKKKIIQVNIEISGAIMGWLD